MIDEVQFYWITRLDDLKNIFESLLLIWLVCIVFHPLLAWLCWNALGGTCSYIGDPVLLAARNLRNWVVSAIFLFTLALLIPTTKEAFLIYGIPKLLQEQGKASTSGEKAHRETLLTLFNQYLGIKPGKKKETD